MTGDEVEHNERDDERGSTIAGDLTQLAEDELRRRTEAPLPRSLIDFLQ